MHYTAEYWIRELDLVPHVEGGAYREVYRSPLQLPREVLTLAHKGDRSAMTSIYYLLRFGECSAFHKIASDETWHHYEGTVLCIYEITNSGQLTRHLLGKDIASGCVLTLTIKGGNWFACRVEETGGYALCGCTVAPGFDYEEFELAQRNELILQYPEHTSIISALTR